MRIEGLGVDRWLVARGLGCRLDHGRRVGGWRGGRRGRESPEKVVGL
jgi:hypothetical protein